MFDCLSEFPSQTPPIYISSSSSMWKHHTTVCDLQRFSAAMASLSLTTTRSVYTLPTSAFFLLFIISSYLFSSTGHLLLLLLSRLIDFEPTCISALIFQFSPVRHVFHLNLYLLHNTWILSSTQILNCFNCYKILNWFPLNLILFLGLGVRWSRFSVVIFFLLTGFQIDCSY